MSRPVDEQILVSDAAFESSDDGAYVGSSQSGIRRVAHA